MFSSKKSKPNTYFQNFYILSNLTPYIFVRFKLKKNKKIASMLHFLLLILNHLIQDHIISYYLENTFFFTRKQEKMLI